MNKNDVKRIYDIIKKFPELKCHYQSKLDKLNSANFISIETLDQVFEFETNKNVSFKITVLNS